MNRAPVRRVLLVLSLQALFVFLSIAARAQDTLRPQAADESSTQLPPGWKSIDRAVYDAYTAAVGAGRAAHAPGSLERATYQLKLQPDGSLTGRFQGIIDLTGDPALIPLGKPSFAMSDVQLDGEKPAWGCDAQGVSRLFCPRDGAALKFQCSQQGVRRGEAVEFNIDWLMSVATQLELSIPPSRAVDTQGLLKTGQRKEPDGSTTLTYEAGARASCTLRIHPQSDAAAQPLGVELRQTLSASPAKILLQSIISVLSTTSAPAFAEFDLPPGFTLTRAALGSDERLPIDVGRKSGPLRIPLGDLAVGQRVELRLVLECPADWNQPFSVPRLTPRNTTLLREELVLQIEQPLEVLDVQAADYDLTALSVEPARREVWTYQAASPEAPMVLTVRAPSAEWSADCFVKRRQQGPRSEIVTLVDLKSQRSPLFEFDVEIARPWKIVSVTAPDPVGNPLPLTYQTLEDSGSFVRHRILLRTPANPQRGSIVTIAVAAQQAEASTSPLKPVAVPSGGRVESYLLVGAADEQSELDPPTPLNSFRSSLRTHAFFEPVRQGTASIHRVAAAKVAKAPQPLPPPPAPAIPSAKPIPAPPAWPLKDGLAVAELRTLIGSSTSPSSHRAQFVFEDPVRISGEVIQFEGDWTLVEVLCDGTPVRAVAQGRELRLPEFSRGVRELTIRYTTATAGPGIPRRDRVDWPQIPARVQSWTWRVEAPAQRRVTAIEAPCEFATGIMRPGLRERLLAPLGRATGVPIFNPLNAEAWRQFVDPSPSSQTAEPQDTVHIAATGREYPTSTSIVSWSASLLTGLNWVLFIGAMLGASVVRRLKRGTFRFAAALSAIAATAAWLMPTPFGPMAGSILGGNLFAYCIPRRLLALRPAPVPRAAGSSIVRFAGVTVLVIAAALFPTLRAIGQTQTASPNVLLLERDGEPTSSVFVSEAVAKDISAWQFDQFGPPFLIRSAQYEVTVDETDLATANLDFDLVVPRPDLTRTVQLPFEGLTFRGPDAARINGERARLVPTADGSGILLSLPAYSSETAGKPASCRIQLSAGIRIPRAESGGSSRSPSPVARPPSASFRTSKTLPGIFGHRPVATRTLVRARWSLRLEPSPDGMFAGGRPRSRIALLQSSQ